MAFHDASFDYRRLPQKSHGANKEDGLDIIDLPLELLNTRRFDDFT